MLRDVVDLQGIAGSLGLVVGPLVAFPPHLIRVPAVAEEWEALVRDLLGYRRYEPAQVEDLEVSLDLRVQAGAVDDRPLGVGAVRLRDLHLLDGKGITDEVLGEALQIFAPAGQDAAAAMAKPCRMTTVLWLHAQPCDFIENQLNTGSQTANYFERILESRHRVGAVCSLSVFFLCEVCQGLVAIGSDDLP